MAEIWKLLPVGNDALGYTNPHTGIFEEPAIVEPMEDDPGEAGLRWSIGRALSEAFGNAGEDGVVHVDPFDSDDITPLVDSVMTALIDHATASNPMSPGRWTIVAPDGWTSSADKPISLVLEATRHQREIDPAEATKQDDRLVSAIDEERRKHEADRAVLVDRFLAWPLPDSVCSDLCATAPGWMVPYSRNGTNLLTGSEARAMLDYVLDCDEADRELGRRDATIPTAADVPVLTDEELAGTAACAKGRGVVGACRAVEAEVRRRLLAVLSPTASAPKPTGEAQS